MTTNTNDPPPHMSPDEFREVGRRIVDWVASYMEHVEDHAVRSNAQPGDVLANLPDDPPDQPGGADEWDSILRDLDSTILPGLMHWQSPGFFGYFPCQSSPPAILAELVSELIGLWAGSLDDPSRFQPQIDVWTASALAWDCMSQTLPKSEHAPTEEQMQKLLAPQG